MQENNYLKLL